MCSPICRCSSAPELPYTKYGSSFNAGNSTYGDTLSDIADMIYRSNSLSDLNDEFPGVSYSTIVNDPNFSSNSLNEKFDIETDTEIIFIS